MIVVGHTGGGAVAKEEVVETDDESAVKSKVECETFTTLEDGTVECLLPYGDVGVVGGKPSAWGAKHSSLIQGPVAIPTIRRNSSGSNNVVEHCIVRAVPRTSL